MLGKQNAQVEEVYRVVSDKIDIDHDQDQISFALCKSVGNELSYKKCIQLSESFVCEAKDIPPIKMAFTVGEWPKFAQKSQTNIILKRCFL